ncbi:hypothetical protein NX059_010787 [Plenodomus lindquistii]|nr:hypothetical protein NX059_010787 [Plenodomus lindquistii]
MVRVVLPVMVLAMVSAVIAQSSNFNGPLFDPSLAPFFGPSSLVYPDIPTLTIGVPTFTQTPTFTFTRSRTSTIISQPTSTQVSSSWSQSISPSSSHSSSSTSRITSPSPVTRSLSTSPSSTAPAPAPTQSTNAAVGKYPGVGGVIGGVLVAGFALV